MDDKLYAFFCKAFLTEAALDRAGRKRSVLNSTYLDEQVASRLPFNLLDPELVLKARRMAIVYTAIASFENSARDFVAKSLLEKYGADWWTQKVSDKIRNRAETRREEEGKIRWHTPRGDKPLNYTELGDLSSIISQNWDDFEPFAISQDWVRSIITTVERSRNVIMHSGELGNEDIERLGSAIRDWTAQIGA